MNYYEKTANELVERILKVASEHPETMLLQDPWGLFNIPGFTTEGLDTTAAQAGWALTKAKEIWKKRQEELGLKGL
jgi:hypothetical protein